MLLRQMLRFMYLGTSVPDIFREMQVCTAPCYSKIMTNSHRKSTLFAGPCCTVTVHDYLGQQVELNDGHRF